MRIAYFAHLDLGKETGALKKVVGQVRAWGSMGQEAMLFALSRSEDTWAGAGDIRVDAIRCGSVGAFPAAHRLARRVLRWRPDVVYLRWGPCYPALLGMMKRFPTVIEINSDDVAEGKLVQSPLRYLYQRLTRGFVLRRARGLVCVTGELADRLRDCGKPTAIVSNGIELSRHPACQAPSNSRPRLVFLGSSRHVWIGLDKILQLAHSFNNWQFDVIGCQPGELGGPVPSNVRAHGHLGKAQYEGILRRANVAIGTLALHRKELDEACPLKVREYLAFGIPTIIGYRDTDFPEAPPFLLQLSNAPDNVASSTAAIADFVSKWKGKRVPREGVSHLDVREKEKQRLAFFREAL